MLRVGILTVGNELTGGRIQDTNSSLIARTVQEQGWSVAAMLSVGDEAAAISDGLAYLLARAEAIVVTGGLGPTADDMTTAAVAQAFGLELVLDEVVLAHIKSLFDKRRLAWTENNAKQALFPRGARVIANPVGTAAGFALRQDGRIVAVIPGVPSEAEQMLKEGVIPLFREVFPGAAREVGSLTLKLFGVTESAIDAALADVDFEALGVSVGFYPRFPENHLVLTARAATSRQVEEMLRSAAEKAEARIGRYVIARGDETLEGTIARLLTEKGLTLAVAESCTGGLITHRLTDVPGSSVFLERGLVTYSNAAKVSLLGVPPEVIAAHGAVSAETARLMAEGVRRMAGTDLGLAATGIAGPTGGTEEKPVGTLFVALADRGGAKDRRHFLRWDRRRNKIMASQAALVMLKRHLAGEKDE